MIHQSAGFEPPNGVPRVYLPLGGRVRFEAAGSRKGAGGGRREVLGGAVAPSMLFGSLLLRSPGLEMRSIWCKA